VALGTASAEPEVNLAPTGHLPRSSTATLHIPTGRSPRAPYHEGRPLVVTRKTVVDTHTIELRPWRMTGAIGGTIR